jgi:hypothetical protein
MEDDEYEKGFIQMLASVATADTCTVVSTISTPLRPDINYDAEDDDRHR